MPQRFLFLRRVLEQLFGSRQRQFVRRHAVRQAGFLFTVLEKRAILADPQAIGFTPFGRAHLETTHLARVDLLLFAFPSVA